LDRLRQAICLDGPAGSGAAGAQEVRGLMPQHALAVVLRACEPRVTNARSIQGCCKPVQPALCTCWTESAPAGLRVHLLD